MAHSNEINVKIRKLRPDAKAPTYATELAAGFDLVAVEDVIIAPGETTLVPTGLAFEIAAGYEMQIRPRSGISLRTKLRVANSPGTVDADFRGEVAVIVDNNEVSGEVSYYWKLVDGTIEPIDCGADEPPFGTYIIRKGDQIAQGVITPIMRASFEITDELTETERGAGGFGHTGTQSAGITSQEADTYNADDYRTFECDTCGDLVTEERGTFAEDNDMCAECWCAYQGG